MKRVVRGFIVRFGNISGLLGMDSHQAEKWQGLQEGACCYGCGLPIDINAKVIPCVKISDQNRICFIHEGECLEENGPLVIKDCAELLIAVAMLLAKGANQTKKRKTLVA